MPTATKEINFEEEIESYLLNHHWYIKRYPWDYDKDFCIDKEMLFEFLDKSQHNAFTKLKEYHGDLFEKKFLKRLFEEIKVRWTIDVLRKGIKDCWVSLDLMYSQPASWLNPETKKLYDMNILSEIRQLKYSNKNENSIDMGIFINWLPIFMIELKNQLSGQNVMNAIIQFRSDRDPIEPLFQFKRCLVYWAVDTDLVYMSTKLAWQKTFFLPFNKWVDLWAWNPINPNWFKTAYLWEDTFSKSSVLELLSNYICVLQEEEEDAYWKKTIKEKLIFPRYHQYDVVRKLLADSKEAWTGKNYLIQHSAWSWKSNSIARLAHHLVELHDKNNNVVFDSVVIVTDRRILDKQLQNTVSQFEQTGWVVKCITNWSAWLKQALEDWWKIIISTLQKFPFVLKDIWQLKWKHFAVIVDEAHSSQAWESSKALKQVLTVDNLEDLDDAEDFDREWVDVEFDDMIDQEVEKQMKSRWKLNNLSFFAFTATPKNKTLELFGVKRPDWWFEAFHLYSMRQAIQENFILDVLKNYTTYQTYFSLIKKTNNDPQYSRKRAVKEAKKYVEIQDFSINKKIKIMVDHFIDKIRPQIWWQAKAMVVTKSRLHAVRYKLAFDKYLEEHWYSWKIKTLVAFSWTVKDKEFWIDYTESSMNWISEKNTAKEFKKPEYKFLIVAEKFQTWFDQPLLTAMYVDKQLNWIAAVQTLSRLNRTHPEKSWTFVLDFVNTADVIQKSFEPYYKTTILSEWTDPNILNDYQRKIMNKKLFYENDIEAFVKVYFRKNSKSEEINALLDPIVEKFKSEFNEEEQDEFKKLCSDYVKTYWFLSQVIDFTSIDLEKLYVYVKLLRKKLPYKKDQCPIDILNQIKTESYKVVERKWESINLEDGEYKPLDPLHPWEQQKREDDSDYLSNILNDINKKFWTTFTEDDKVVLNNIYQKLFEREDMKWYMLNRKNSKEDVERKFWELFVKELIKMVADYESVHKKLDENGDLKEYIKNIMFEQMYRKVVEDVNNINI